MSESPDFEAIFNQVHGFLSLDEAKMLYRLASEVLSGGTIIEIGSYQGRSTVCLGLGAKVNGARVYAIDPHDEYEAGGTLFSMADNQYYYANLAKFGVGDVVRTYNTTSMKARETWGANQDVALLFIDGSHIYANVYSDFHLWTHRILTGKVVMHDASGFHPGVTQALDEILVAGQWRIEESVDAAVVLVRAK